MELANEADKLRDKLQLVKGKVITENLIQVTKNQVKDYYVKKDFCLLKPRLRLKKIPLADLIKVSRMIPPIKKE